MNIYEICMQLTLKVVDKNIICLPTNNESEESYNAAVAKQIGIMYNEIFDTIKKNF